MNQKRYSLSKDKIQVVLLEGVHPCAQQAFEEAGYTDIKTFSKALTPSELQKTLSKAHIVGIRSRTQLDSAILAEAKRLMAIGCFCIGTNQVDLEVSQNLGVPVFNAPYANTRSVAELVLAEMVLLLRQVPAKSQACHEGQWLKSADSAFEARGKTLGIIGYGHIGSQLGVLAESLGMQVLYHDIESKLPLGNATAVSLERLLKQSDAVSLHVPETPQTQMMINAKALSKMKPTAVLINASRGTVVDIPALAEALKQSLLLGAAVDVFPVEPKSNQDVFQSELQGLDNVILTPHIGGSTQEAQENIALEVSHKLIRYSDNGSTLSAVNFPEVALPSHEGRRRFIHIHENRPGILGAINELFSEAGANIAGQYLQTKNHVGYVVVDIENAQQSNLLKQLKAIPGTIKARVLF